MAVAFGIEDSDGTVLAISVYSDGIAEHAGHTVAKHYATWELAAALIALGDLSWVGKAIGSQTDFKEAQERQGYAVPAQCLAYARDRGEPWEHNQPRRFTSRDQYRRMQGFNGWHYLFDRKAGQWLTYSCSRWVPVELPAGGATGLCADQRISGQSEAVRHSVPNWMVNIFRAAFPELSAMADDELARRVAAVEKERDTVGHLFHLQAIGRCREQFHEGEELPF